jgi:hypothetical protein
MLVSEARLAANRKNALLSSGPKTDEGKAISRRNGLKHGLSGEGVVVAEADAAEIERRVEELENDMKPMSPGGVHLIRVMAAASVVMERATGQETAAIARRVRHACADHDEAMHAEADALFEGLEEDPRKNLRKLKRTPEGVDRLIEAWSDLADDVERDEPSGWAADQLRTATLLLGKKADTGRASRLGVLTRAVGGDFLGLAKGDGEGLKDDARRAWAKARIAERIASEIAALEAHRETLDLDAFEQDRVEAPSRALFDVSKEATLARRYEQAASRRYFRALTEFRRVEAESLAKADWPILDETEPAPAAPLGSLGESGAPLYHGTPLPRRLPDPPASDVVVGHDEVALVIGQRPKLTR